MTKKGEVLIAIINNHLDFSIVREQQWYRIPLDSAKKLIKDHWPPKWIAFYQTQVFGDEKYSIKYYAEVLGIKEVFRWELFPEEIENEKNKRKYFQIILGPLQALPKPIRSTRWRRIVFIPTTWDHFINADETNDLYAESPLEDKIWREFKRKEIIASRQELVQIKNNYYFLDFAIYCVKGKLDVETDGDNWHANPVQAKKDNKRDNNLKTDGWRVLRFNTNQIMEEMEEYCLPTVVENINKFGGIETGNVLPKIIRSDSQKGFQRSLFDELD